MAKAPEKEEVKEVKSQSYSTFSGNRGWAYGAGAVLVIILVFALGVAAANHHRRMEFRTANIAGGPAFRGKFGMHRGFGGGMGGNATVNGQSRLNGVVISVNGSNFTVAGHGSTTNVTTNSSTQYQGGNQVKQNDSIIVFGTTSNNTLTATQIVINP